MRKIITAILSIGFLILFDIILTVKLNTELNSKLNIGIRLKLLQEDRDAASIEEASDETWEYDIHEDSSNINELMEKYETEKF
jgi:hypothetical protein